MRSALATLDGIDESNVDVNYETKVVVVDVADTNLTADDLVSAFEGSRFSATPN